MFFGIKNFDMVDWIMGSDVIVDADQKKSPLQSMKIYIMMAGAGVLFMVVLCIIMLYKPCRQKMKEKLIGIKKNFIWNGFLRSFYISLMKQWQSVAEQLIKIRTGSVFFVASELYTTYGIAGFCLFVPVVSWIFLQSNRRYLGLLEYREKYENLYSELSLRRDGGKYTLMYYPIFMFRRCLFMMWPVVFVNNEAFQVQALIATSTAYTIYYNGTKPHVSVQKQYLETFNEIMVMFLNYQTILFSKMNLNVDLQYKSGYAYVLTMVFTISVNIYIMVKNTCAKAKRKRILKKAM